MTPERPRRADATDALVETPLGVSRGPEPSALPGPGPAPLYAALDLGTNSCRMLIAQPLGSQFLIVDSFSSSLWLSASTSLVTASRVSRAMSLARVRASAKAFS